MLTNLTAVLEQLLQNTSNRKVLQQLMTPDATYVSLNFSNPELEKIEPWAGTHKGPQALSDVFAAIQRFWKTLDFKVTDAAAAIAAARKDKLALRSAPVPILTAAVQSERTESDSAGGLLREAKSFIRW